MSKLESQSINKLPVSERTEAKPEIVAHLNQAKATIRDKVNQQADRTERKINHTTTMIRHNTKAQFSKVFIDIYKAATPFAFAMVLLALIFRRNKRTA